MWYAITQISVSEVLLLFVLLFVLPGMTYMVLRMRRLEALSGAAPRPEEKKKKKDAPPPPAEKKLPDNVFPYKRRAFLSHPELACLAALREALGPDLVEVPVKVALGEALESTDPDPGYAERLGGLALDFLICDKPTGQPLAAVVFNPGKGRPAGRVELLKKCCAAAGLPVVGVDMAETFDAQNLKAAIGIPELGL